MSNITAWLKKALFQGRTRYMPIIQAMAFDKVSLTVNLALTAACGYSSLFSYRVATVHWRKLGLTSDWHALFARLPTLEWLSLDTWSDIGLLWLGALSACASGYLALLGVHSILLRWRSRMR
jgi:hypothetical protein